MSPMLPKIMVAAGAFALAAVLQIDHAQADKRTLTLANFPSAKTYHNSTVYPQFMKGVTKDTDGAITWEFLPGGQVVSGRTTLSALRDGIIDIGLVIQNFTRRELAANNTVFEMHFHGTDGLAVSAASVETIMHDCPQCQEEWRKYNSVYLSGYSTTPFMLFCRDEVKSLADLSGKRARSTGAAFSRWLTHIGMVPVTMTGPEGAPAMQRGAVDCATASAAWLTSFGYLDVTRSILDFTMGSSRGNGLVVMNRNSWDKLTTEQKRAVLDNAIVAQAELTIGGYVELDARQLALAKKRNIPLHKGGGEFDEMLKKHLDNEATALPADMKPLGVRDPEAIMAAFERNLAKWEKLVKDIGTDRDKYVAALRREIYDRIDINNL